MRYLLCRLRLDDTHWSNFLLLESIVPLLEAGWGVKIVCVLSQRLLKYNALSSNL
jgi:hypothetical protein